MPLFIMYLKKKNRDLKERCGIFKYYIYIGAYVFICILYMQFLTSLCKLYWSSEINIIINTSHIIYIYIY